MTCERSHRRAFWRRVRGAGIAASVLVMCSLAQGQQDQRAIRAAFVFNLTKYSTWPEQHNPLVICFLGAGEMGPTLAQVLSGKSSDGRRIYVEMRGAEADIHRCQVMYAEQKGEPRAERFLDQARSEGVLTIGESESFVRKGGMVALVRMGDQIQVEVNLDAIHAARLSMSSRLLDLAVIVRSAKEKR